MLEQGFPCSPAGDHSETACLPATHGGAERHPGAGFWQLWLVGEPMLQQSVLEGLYPMGKADDGAG